jgi:hypothetical protein
VNLRTRYFTTTASVLSILLGAAVPALPTRATQTAIPVPERQIDLRAMNFAQPKIPNYSNSELFSDISLFFQDVHPHVEFVSESELVVYSSDVVDERVAARKGQLPSPEPAHSMQAFFVDADDGNLISHQVWQTRRRRFFNTKSDTQAQIMPVRDGFLLHANDTLALYSADLHKKQEIQLDPSSEYAALVAPGGDVFFLERSNPGVIVRSGSVSAVVNAESGLLTAHGEWRSSETFEKLRSRDLYPGAAQSVSSDSFAERWYQCVDLQRADSPQSHLCCGNPCSYGLAMYLDDREIVMLIRSGFQVLSTSGEVLWRREDPNWNNFEFYDDARSLDGSQFAMLLFAYRKIKFDDTQMPKRWFAVLVYDRGQRTKVSSVVLKSENAPAFALSPEGHRLAVLSGTSLLLYRIPET